MHPATFRLMKEELLNIAIVFMRSLLRIFFPLRRDQEILMLRKELQILKRKVKRPQFTSWDRLFFVSLFRINEKVIENIVSIKPSTVISWHRKLAAKKWDYSKRLSLQ